MLFWKTRVFVLDIETVADPRVAQFLALGLIHGRFIVPEPPSGRNAGDDHRAQRAWETIDRLKQTRGITVKVDRALLDKNSLLAAVRRNRAVLLTVDPGLKTAGNGLPVVTTGEIYNLFKPLYLPGTELTLRVSKRGKEKDEGIGYLDGGVKVVIADGARAIGKELDVVVQGALDTDVGRVVFARPRFTDV